MIEVNGLTKSFRTYTKTDSSVLQVVNNVSFTAGNGEVVTIIGPSGCGKTTLLRCIAGIERKDAGSIIIDGKEVEGVGSDRGLVFQTFNLYPWMTVEQNVWFGILDLLEQERKERTAKYIKLVGLSGFEKYHPHQLSGGMQQRVGVARALAIEPKILLLDEPLANVDSQTAERLVDEFLRIFAETGKSIVYVTHNIDEAVYASDKVIVLSHRPATVKLVVDVKLPKPRWEHQVRATSDFGVLRTRVKEALEIKAS